MIGLVGSTLFAQRTAIELGKKGCSAEIISKVSDSFIKKDLSSYSIIHFISSPTVWKSEYRKLLRCALLKNKKIVITWIGSDVLRASESTLWSKITKVSQFMVDVNLATSQNLVDELNQIGVKAKYLPLPVYTLYDLEKFPAEDNVLVYLPDQTKEKWDFYQGDKIKRLVKDFENVNFVIVPNSGKNFDEKNVSCIEWVENMKELYEKSKVVIRLPKHDGTSGTIVEALSIGRNMICSNTEVPYSQVSDDYEEIKEALRDCIENPKLNEEGSKYAHDKFNSSRLAGELIDVYDKIN